MIETIKLIEQWGYDKNIHLSSPLLQTTKSDEECVELKQAIIRRKELEQEFCNANTSLTIEEYKNKMYKYREEIKDAIGDIFVTLVMLSIQEESIYISLPTKISFGVYNVDVYYEIERITINLLSIQSKLRNHEIKTDLNVSMWTILYSLQYIASKYNFTLEECVKYAYNQIKDREGEMKNGLWVKND